jgi:RNA polymerase sigma-70 factor (ECF subfamily)
MNPVEFSTLYRRYAPDVLRFVTFLTGDRAEAEEITQETFVRAWVAAGAIRAGTVKAYLFAIARNLHLDRGRDQARRGDLPADRVDPAPSAEAVLDTRRALGQALAALQTLPEVDRAALLMRTTDDMSYDDIATALGITTGAARVKVHRARVRVAELCGNQEDV